MYSTHAITEIARDKRRLRQQLLLKRQQMSHAAMVQASESAARHYADHPILAFTTTSAGYIAMRGELDILPIFSWMERYQKITALPRMDSTSKQLNFYPWQVREPLHLNAHGVREPSPDTDPITPDVVLVPLIAFDADGFRLGYGGGWYDRTIAHRRSQHDKTLFFGVAYSQQEVDRLPIEDHDQPLDGILTERGVSMFNSL